MKTSSYEPVKHKATKVVALTAVQLFVAADALRWCLGGSSTLGGWAFIEMILAGLIFASILALLDSKMMSLMYVLGLGLVGGLLVCILKK